MSCDIYHLCSRCIHTCIFPDATSIKPLLETPTSLELQGSEEGDCFMIARSLAPHNCLSQLKIRSSKLNSVIGEAKWSLRLANGFDISPCISWKHLVAYPKYLQMLSIRGHLNQNGCYLWNCLWPFWWGSVSLAIVQMLCLKHDNLFQDSEGHWRSCHRIGEFQYRLLRPHRFRYCSLGKPFRTSCT